MKKLFTLIHKGASLRDIYPHATRSQVYKYRVMKWLVKFTVAAVEVGIVYVLFAGCFFLGQNMKTNTVFAEREVTVDRSDEKLALKIDGLKNELVESLRKCESAGRKEQDGIIIYDPLVSNPSATSKRDVPSIGTLQFKQSTVIYYYKTLYNKVITGKEAAMIALDDKKASELAKEIMFKTKNRADDWMNCSNKLGLNSQIELIKKLEK